MPKLSIKDLDLKGQRVFIRVDFNVPLKNGVIGDDTRIKSSIPTIRYALAQGATVVLASHLGRPKGKVNRLFIGGAMAYTFFKSRGVPVGKCLVEDDKLDQAKAIEADAKTRGVALLLPTHHVVAAKLEAGAAHETLAVGDAAIGDRM